MLITKESKLKPRVIIYGNSGSGKTTFASTAANLGNTLLIAYKSQPQVVLYNEYKYNLTVYEVNTLDELNDILSWLYLKRGKIQKEFEDANVNTEFEWVIMDGFTQAQFDYGAILVRDDLRNEDHPVWKPSKFSLTNLSTLEWPQYADLLNFSNSLTTHLWNLPYSVVVTCLERDGDIASLGSGADLLMSGSNVLGRSVFDGKRHLLRIKQTPKINASYRYIGKHDKEVLVNATLKELIND